MPDGDLTYAQEDALERLRKKHKHTPPGVLVSHQAADGRLCIMLPGDESPRRRRRFITKTGIVERAHAGD